MTLTREDWQVVVFALSELATAVRDDIADDPLDALSVEFLARIQCLMGIAAKEAGL
jgi:hypothetical protein